MSDRLILVGRIAGAFGVRGEVRVTSFTADPMTLAGFRDLKRADGSPAPALRGLKLHVPRSALPAEDEDEFYLADLVGMRVETPDGQVLGAVRGVQDFGAGDLLEIKPEGAPSFWLPFTREAVPEVDVAGGRIVAVPPAETE